MPSAAPSTVEVCAVNIGPAERAKRMRFGLVALALSVGLAALLIGLKAPRLARSGLFLPLLVAGIGVFQAREKT
jgi:hypothetical protein